MKILVAVDRSEESSNALENALDIVDVVDADVTAVHVRENSDDPTREDGREDRQNEVLRHASERAADRDISIDTELLSGDPTGTITEYAEAHAFDVIYVGHRGLSGENEELPGDNQGALGTVSKGILESTTVPVTVFDRSRD